MLTKYATIDSTLVGLQFETSTANKTEMLCGSVQGMMSESNVDQ